MRSVVNLLKGLVGAWRFELQASCAQGRRATRLRYAPTEVRKDYKVLLNRTGAPSVPSSLHRVNP
jgi:hypothetical protein